MPANHKWPRRKYNIDRSCNVLFLPPLCLVTSLPTPITNDRGENIILTAPRNANSN